MLRLLALGGAAIVDESRDPGSAATQRRTLALVSVLAVAGEVGVSRDKLVSLFWPEADTERGRHALTQALYASRRGLRCDDLFLVNGDVKLNPARITSDVDDLDAALSRHEEGVAGLYRGPFLDGFFLSGSAEFEQWVSAQRAKIEERVVRTFERLAMRAQEARDARRAADWWKRAAAIRPLDSGFAVHLMEMLALAGDRAGALRHATVHSALLRNELDLGPDATVTELAESLRETCSPHLADVRHDAEPADSPIQLASPALPAGVAEAPTRDVAVWIPKERRKGGLSLVLGAALLVATAIAIGRRHPTRPEFRPVPLRQKVVVAPFRVAGAASSLAYLRDGMVELLSTRLADDSAARSVDAGAVIGAWRAAGLAPAMDIPRDTVVRLAAALGAERVVVGGVVGTPDHVVMRATVLHVPSGAVASQATVEGSADSLTVLVDRLAASLLVVEAGESDRLGKHVTSSLSALRAYLAGQAAFRRNDYDTAIRQYEIALRRDSGFALAALRLSLAADRAGNAFRMRRALEVAWSFRGELAERDLAMLFTYTGTRFPAPSSSYDQVTSWRRAADLTPLSAEAWFALGQRLFHEGAIAGVDAPASRAATSLHHVLLLDSNYAPAARLLVQIGTASGAVAELSSTVLRTALNDSLSPLAPFLRWRLAVARHDTSELGAIRGDFTRFGPANLRAVALASQFDAAAIDDGVRALAMLRARGPARSLLPDVVLGEHAMALNEGRIRDALDVTSRLQVATGDRNVELRLRALDALYGDGDISAARAAVQSLEQGRRAPSVADSSSTPDRLADLCVIGQWRLANGNSSEVPDIITALRSARVLSATVLIGSLPTACAEILDVGLAVATRRRDARGRLAHLDSLAFTPETSGDAVAYAPLWIARLHERVGDSRGALRAVRRRQYMSDWPRYLAAMLREEGRLAESTGDLVGAAQAYERYLILRHAPSDALRPQADSVRAAVGRLAGRPSPRLP